MAALLADDYIGITANGTIENKDQALARLRAGGRHITSLTISERKVRFYEKTAVVTCLVDVKGTNIEGADVSGSYRYTRVYIRDEQGKWKIVSFEASRIREPGRRGIRTISAEGRIFESVPNGICSREEFSGSLVGGAEQGNSRSADKAGSSVRFPKNMPQRLKPC